MATAHAMLATLTDYARAVANLRATYDLDLPEDLAIAQTQVIQTLYAESHE